MKYLSTHLKNRAAWRVAALACLLLAALSLSLVYPLIQAHAQDCLDCIGGGDPTQEPDPTEPPDDPPDDPPGPPDEPPPPTEPPCDPYFDAPLIETGLGLDPAYPITLGQDPDDRGVDVSGITARGGQHHCPSNGRAGIVSFSVVRVELAESSVAWINGPLARKYPGAHVKGSYPFTPAFNASGIGSSQAQLAFHLAPLDPGYYEVTVQVMQEDGQSASAVLRVPVHLLESAIIE